MKDIRVEKWLLALVLTVLAMAIVAGSCMLGMYLMGPIGAVIFVIIGGGAAMELLKYIKE